MGKELPPFAPPKQEKIDEAMRPEDFEAKEQAEKIQRESLPEPVGFTINHEMVGPWVKNQRVSREDVLAHLGDKHHRITDPKECEVHINRLLELNAFVPHFE